LLLALARAFSARSAFAAAAAAGLAVMLLARGGVPAASLYPVTDSFDAILPAEVSA